LTVIATTKATGKFYRHALSSVFYVFVVALILLRPGEAASFACDAARATPRERLVCGDPELSSADGKLAAAYRAALSALSEKGRSDLRNGQRDWLRYTQAICWIDGKAPSNNSKDNCLKTEYEKRQKQLDNAAVKAGGMVIRRVDRFSVTYSTGRGSGGSHPGFNTTVISFPQIDKPNNARERAWNKLIAKHKHAGLLLAAVSANNSSDSEDDSDLLVDYVLGSVSPSMISLWLQVYYDAHGAHGTAQDEGITWLLGERRALRAQDVFDASRPWDEALARLVLQRAKREASGDLAVSEPSEIIDKVRDPAHWLIVKRALVFRFVSESAPSCCAAIEATIPWTVMKPYLRSPLPFSTAPN
jgi:uncharacterized protein